MYRILINRSPNKDKQIRTDFVSHHTLMQDEVLKESKAIIFTRKTIRKQFYIHNSDVIQLAI